MLEDNFDNVAVKDSIRLRADLVAEFALRVLWIDRDGYDSADEMLDSELVLFEKKQLEVLIERAVTIYVVYHKVS